MSNGAKLLVLAAVLVLGFGVALLRLIGGDSANATVRHTDKPEPTAEPAPAAAPSPERWDKAPATAKDLPKSAGEAPKMPSITSLIPSSSDDPVQVDPETGRPIPVVKLDVLREANAATNDAIRDCIAKANYTGSGKAILTMIVAKKKDTKGERVEVEDTGMEEEGTTISDPALIECMHKTALAIKLPVGKSSIPVWAKRRVEIKDGKLEENWIFNWRHIR